MPYVTEARGTMLVFDVQPDPLPEPPGGLDKKTLLIAAAIAVVLLFVVPPIATLLLVGIAAYAFAKSMSGGIFAKAHRTASGMDYRRPTHFEAGPDGIRINGTLLPKDAIHRIKILSRTGEEPGGTGVVRAVDPFSTSGRAYANARQRMEAYLRDIGRVTYRVVAEVRGEATLLGGGVTEPVAFAIRADVNRAMGSQL